MAKNSLSVKSPGSATAVATSGAYSPGHHEAVPLSVFVPSPYQPRKFPDDKAWAELPETREFVASIRGAGVRVPVHARQHPTRVDLLELVDGERRIRGAKLAGLATVPALVFVMTDAEAAAMTYLANQLRAGLTLWEEVEAVNTSLTTYRGDEEAVAAFFGRTAHWVRMRARMTELTPRWREVAQPGGGFERWTAAHWELIARFPRDAQDGLDMERFWSGMSVNDLKHQLESATNILKGAPWPLDDATLAEGRPACCNCQSRSDAILQQNLFDDEDDVDVGDPDKPSKKARCLRPDCWKTKAGAFTLRRLDELRAKQPGARVAVRYGGMGQTTDTLKKHCGAPVVEAYHLDKAKKKGPDAVPVIVVDNSGAGAAKIEYFTRASVERTSSSKSGAAGRGAGPKTLAQRRKELVNRRWMQVFLAMRKDIEKAGYERLGGNVDPGWRAALLMALATVFGVEHGYSSVREDRARLAKKLDNLEAAAPELWAAVRNRLALALAYSGSAADMPPERIRLAEDLAKLVGTDLAKLEEKAAKDLPEPKSWAKLAKAEAEARTAKRKGSKAPAFDGQKAAAGEHADDYAPDDGEEGDGDEE